MDEVSLLGDSQVVRVRRTCFSLYRASDGGNNDCSGSGWTTRDLLYAVRSRRNTLRPVCVIMIGINDIIKNLPISLTKKSISTIIDILAKSRKSILISTLPPTLHSNSSPVHQSIRNLNVFIQSFNTHPQTTVINFHKQFIPFSSFNPSLFQQQYTDGRPDLIHLSAAGHSLLITLINSKLADNAP